MAARPRRSWLRLVSGYKDLKAYDIVRNYWLPVVGGEKAWRKALHDGVIRPALCCCCRFRQLRCSTRLHLLLPTGGYEVIFVPSWSVFDGRFANNAWLQETPDPMTKLTWDNAALVSPATARKLAVAMGDVISIERNGRKVEGRCHDSTRPGGRHDRDPGRLWPYESRSGRRGRRLQRVQDPHLRHIRVRRRIQRVARRAAFIRLRARRNSTTRKSRSSSDSRKKSFVRSFAKARSSSSRKNPQFAQEMVEHPPLKSLYGDYDYSKGQQWAMAIDLNACIGCNACMVACQAENNIAVVGKEQVARGREMHWIRIDRYYTGPADEPQVVTAPIPCMQCETAPCENVCPVAATVHSPEGLNDMVYNRCVGTRYCSNNCPYKVRRFNFLNWHINEAEVTEDGL